MRVVLSLSINESNRCRGLTLFIFSLKPRGRVINILPVLYKNNIQCTSEKCIPVLYYILTIYTRHQLATGILKISRLVYTNRIIRVRNAFYLYCYHYTCILLNIFQSYNDISVSNFVIRRNRYII